MKPTDRETTEFISEEIQDATSSNERERKHAEGAYGGSIGNDVSDGSNSGGIASMEGESAAQARMDKGDPISSMNPDRPDRHSGARSETEDHTASRNEDSGAGA
jgi:hypothetical protein